MMCANNPQIIPRNHIIEEVLSAASIGDVAPMNEFIDVLKDPYKKRDEIIEYQAPPKNGDGGYKTFCGT